MPENEKEKAEKIAAAKKRYEQLKKQKAKKAPAKDKAEGKAEKLKGESDQDITKEAPDDTAIEDKQQLVNDQNGEEEASKIATSVQEKTHSRQSSMSQQSRIRSSSFRAGLKDGPSSPTARSPTLRSGPLSPAADAADVYRKQSLRIEELEKENKNLQKDIVRLRTVEEELEELRESSSDKAAANIHAADVEKVQAELSALKRQNTQLTQQLNSKKPRQDSSGSADPALQADLESKNTTIATLELEMSARNAQITALQEKQDGQTAVILTLESRLKEVIQTTSPADTKSTTKVISETEAVSNSRLSELEGQLAEAKQATKDAELRAAKLDQKISALNTLHREAETRHSSTLADGQKADGEVKELKMRLAALQTETSRLREEAARRARIEASGDAEGLEEIEDEERLRLSNRVRELEEQNFELRRGAWRDARKSMQPGLDGDDGVLGDFDDVDLSTSTRDKGLASRAASQRNHSTFTDVINSGINAFTAAPTRARQQSMTADALGDDDDFNFDEDAFRKAHEEETKARLERVREVKRGLPKWHGWRVDLADLRAGLGGVFDV